MKVEGVMGREKLGEYLRTILAPVKGVDLTLKVSTPSKSDAQCGRYYTFVRPVHP